MKKKNEHKIYGIGCKTNKMKTTLLHSLDTSTHIHDYL